MAYDRNAAYDYIRAGAAEEMIPKLPEIDVPDKKESYIEDLPEIERAPKRASQTRMQAKAEKRQKTVRLVKYCVLGSFVALVVGVIIQGQAQLTEVNQKISSAYTVLAEQKSFNTQLSMKVEAKFSPTIVEQYATDNLSMAKADPFQKEYIKISDGDKAVVVEDLENSVIKDIVSWLTSLG